MTEFEPQTSGIGSNRSTDWATQPLPFDKIVIWHLSAFVQNMRFYYKMLRKNASKERALVGI